MSKPLYKIVCVLLWGLLIFAPSPPLFAQDQTDAGDLVEEAPETPAAPAQVDIQPRARDEEIAERLTSILTATEWFIDPQAEVQDGVVFLRGQTRREEWRQWAGDLARNTQDVVAVVNRIEELPRPLWDFTPAWDELRTLWRDSVQALPLVAFGLLLLGVTWLLTNFTVRVARRVVKDRVPSPLLVNVVAWTMAAPILLIGIYIVLRIAGLTQLALTVLGGTGLAGLVIGIAFRDIAENFLASILLSIRNPFRAGDRVDVAGFVGIVQRVTTRGTILMTLDGNHVQIPNSTVYKSTITNYTANPSRRMEFTVGIGYETAIPDAQSVIGQVLMDHPIVLDKPEPLVLVEELGASTVNLCVYFWFNGTQYEGLRLKSSLIRLVKRALESSGISMPDEAREVIFPQGVPVFSPQSTPASAQTLSAQTPDETPLKEDPVTSDPLSTEAEGGLRSEDAEIQAQARHSRAPEEGEDLLDAMPQS
ncbi:MAG: mechanosensitive ion channel family protein [Caldilineaceae bacterium]